MKVHYSFRVCSSVDGHLGWLHNLAAMKSAALVWLFNSFNHANSFCLHTWVSAHRPWSECGGQRTTASVLSFRHLDPRDQAQAVKSCRQAAEPMKKKKENNASFLLLFLDPRGSRAV